MSPVKEIEDKEKQVEIIKEGKQPNIDNMNLGVKEKSPCTPQIPRYLFYAVHVPSETECNEKESKVFRNRCEALRFLKQNKRARFKAFTSELEAIKFSKCGYTSVEQLSPTTQQSQHSQASCPGQERSPPFKAPKIQELIQFRKAIEVGDFLLFKNYVDENPRYLISSGDTPSILREGPRYNALHIAARHNMPEIAAYILDLVASKKLTIRMYGTRSTAIDIERRSKLLLDLFLNTPDKSLNETPLHFASKIGSIAVVKILICYRECEITKCNKYGQTALDMVCSRASDDMQMHRETLIGLLRENYYVPIFRSCDNTVQPTIGEPVTISKLSPSSIVEETPTSPSISVHAIAGPMSKSTADLFKRRWKTPPFVRSSEFSPELRPSLYDLDKGLERIGRSLAAEFNIQWFEYWGFLDAYVDLVSKEGLQMLEKYLLTGFSLGVSGIYNQYLSDVSPIHRSSSSKSSVPYHVCTTSNSEVGLCACYRVTELDEAGRTETLSVTVGCFDRFLEIFAHRLFMAILEKQRIFIEIDRLESFLRSCSKDSRFTKINFYRSHYRFSELVELKLREEEEDIPKLIPLLKTLLRSNIGSGNQRLRRSILCIFSFILELLLTQLKDRKIDSTPISAWENAKSCNCKFGRERKSFTVRAPQDDETESDEDPIVRPSGSRSDELFERLRTSSFKSEEIFEEETSEGVTSYKVDKVTKEFVQLSMVRTPSTETIELSATFSETTIVRSPRKESSSQTFDSSEASDVTDEESIVDDWETSDSSSPIREFMSPSDLMYEGSSSMPCQLPSNQGPFTQWIKTQEAGQKLKPIPEEGSVELRSQRGLESRESSDSAEDESDDYFTPPSTPDRSESPEIFEEFPSIPDIYLAGYHPTKLDAAVLNAISDVEINTDNYPFIYYWKKACESKSQRVPKESWPTPRRSVQSSPVNKHLPREIISPLHFE